MKKAKLFCLKFIQCFIDNFIAPVMDVQKLYNEAKSRKVQIEELNKNGGKYMREVKVSGMLPSGLVT